MVWPRITHGRGGRYRLLIIGLLGAYADDDDAAAANRWRPRIQRRLPLPNVGQLLHDKIHNSGSTLYLQDLCD